MERLTNADINELTYWYSTPTPAYVAGHLAAQSYEPGGGTYDRTTDLRLEKLVQAGISRAQSEWTRIKKVIDTVADGENGPLHVEILRRAFGPTHGNPLPTKEFHYPEVAIVTPTALRVGRELARQEEHVRLVAVAITDAMRDGVSPMTVAMRALQTDAYVSTHGFAVTQWMVENTILCRLVEATAGKAKATAENVAFSADVRAEMHELVATAGDAYRRARKQLGASRREAKAEARKKNEALLDEMLGKKRAKEAAKFAAKLKRSA